MTNNRIALSVAIAAAMAGCTGDHVTLRGDDGDSEVRYSCARFESQLATTEALTIIRDYTLRLAKKAVEDGDSVQLQSLMRQYEAHEWPALERVAASAACKDGVIEPAELAFPGPGSLAPSFTLATLENQAPVSLADYHGRLIVVDFWATWCQPCIRELPKLAATAQEYSDRMVILAVLHDDSPDAAKEWVARSNTHPVVYLLDPDQTAAKEYRIFGLPTTFVLDEQGRVLASLENPRVRMQVGELEGFLKGTERKGLP